MLGNIFTKTLRDNRKALIWWSLGIIAVVLLNLLYYPSIKGLTEFDKFLRDSPELKALAGNVTSLISPEGFLNSQLYALVAPLLLLIYAIGNGSFAIAGEEGQRTLPLVLAAPISRAKFLVHKYGAMVASTTVLTIIFLLAMIFSIVVVNMDISLWKVTAATLSLLLLALTFGSFALMLGAAGLARSTAVGITGGVATLTYFLNSLAPLIKDIDRWKWLSPFYYYFGNDPLTNGLSLGDASILAASALVFGAVSLVLFWKRDIAA